MLESRRHRRDFGRLSIATLRLLLDILLVISSALRWSASPLVSSARASIVFVVTVLS